MVVLGCGFRLLREVLAPCEVRWPGGVVLGGTPWGTLRLHRSEACVSKEGTGARALLWCS